MHICSSIRTTLLTDPDAADGDRHAQRADESTEQSSATRRVLEVIPEEGPMKEEVDCGREAILADDSTPVASNGNTPDIHAKEESTIEGTLCVRIS